MNNQKDIQKTGLNLYGQDGSPGDNSLLNKPIYNYINKKTEKLVTALYMVTDCMEKDDALKEKLRLLGVQLLSNTYQLTLIWPDLGSKGDKIRSSLNFVYEILSFIEIANTMGYISDMNCSILKKEFNLLTDEFTLHLPKEKSFSFDLDEKMFEIPKEESKTEKLSFINKNSTKRTNNMSFINNKTNSDVLYNVSFIDHKKIKSDRMEKVVSIVKEKGEVAIKDISLAFPECSEKTIQRELNDLIEKGQIQKIGDKRWSRYSLITNE